MRALGIALVLGVLGALAAGTRVPYAAHSADVAAIRLAWRALGENAMRCRTPSAEEQAGLPAHMRRQEICERRLPAFRLRVAVDGVRAVDERIAPAGAAGDRAAVVLRELRVSPGEHRLRIEFAAEEAAAGLPPKRFDETLTLAAGEVALVMEDPTTRELAVRTRRR